LASTEPEYEFIFTLTSIKNHLDITKIRKIIVKDRVKNGGRGWDQGERVNGEISGNSQGN